MGTKRRKRKKKRRRRWRRRKYQPKGLKVAPNLNHCINISINIEEKKKKGRKNWSKEPPKI